MYKIDIEKCRDCGYCSYVCPFSAITHKVDEFYYEIDQTKCQKCGICFSSCIGGFISRDKEDKTIVSIKIGDECIGCTMCARNCPSSAIISKVKEKHIIDETKCIKCGICATKCIKKCIQVEREK